MLQYSTTPIQEITDHPLLKKAGIRLLVKREDLNHPFVSGNKWWKLKYNLSDAMDKKFETLLTFGGAFSNHIYATSAAAHELKLESIGIIRGEETTPLNPTLAFAASKGMRIQYVSRTSYRQKATDGFIDKLHERFGNFFMIPEGGTNLLAIRGCAEFAREHLSEIDFDHLFLPAATGGTMAGMICGFKGDKKITGISVLKDGGFLEKDVEKLVKDFSGTSFTNWNVLTGYQEGGYAKVTTRLSVLIQEMKSRYNLPLDQVYTGKILLGVMKEIERGAFERGVTLLVLHTGGIQGVSFVPPISS